METENYRRQYNQLQRARKKLGIPVTSLDIEIVNLIFGQTDYKTVYKSLLVYKKLKEAGTRANVSPKQMLDYLEAFAACENVLED